jgi:RecB family exonuclease
VERRQAAPEAAPPKLFLTEKALRIDLSSEMALTGRIDRVDEHHDGALEIIDYKSGRETVTEEDVAGSLAMSVYQLLVKKKHPDRRVFATLVALRTGAKASHEMDDGARDALLERCRESGEEIRARDWEAVLPVVNDNCPHCDFLPHCARHWRMQARRDGTPVPEIAADAF